MHQPKRRQVLYRIGFFRYSRVTSLPTGLLRRGFYTSFLPTPSWLVQYAQTTDV